MIGAALLLTLFAATAVLASGEISRPFTDPVGQRYEVDALVLENRSHGPELCAGLIATSLPPQCRGVPVQPWHWRQVDGEESLGGTTWAHVRLVGTFDGQVFHPTARPAPIGPRPPTEPPRSSPCPPPDGGWTVVDPSKSSEADARAAMRHADGQPDVAGAWFTWPKGEPTTPFPAYAEAVVNLAFTGDHERHQRDARARWGGPLCVTTRPRTRAALNAAANDITTAGAAADGIHLLSWAVDEAANVVQVDVLLADDATQRWFEGRYGPGVVRLVGRLRPVS
jgi:hypothetical protein